MTTAREHHNAVWQPANDDLAILRHLAAGETLELVARNVGLSDRTVRRRLRTIADRFDVDTTIEAVVHAVRRRLI